MLDNRSQLYIFTEVTEILLCQVKFKSKVMHVMARNRSTKLIKDILEEVPDHIGRQLVSATDQDGSTVLHKAARNRRHPDAILTLINYVQTKFSQEGKSVCHSVFSI
jgi:hypothetical protein